MLRCPVCKAENTTAICRRCKADLSLLHDLEQQRSACLARACSLLAQRRHGQAHAAAALANHLRCDEESLQLLALTSLAIGDYAQAWRLYQSLQAGDR